MIHLPNDVRYFESVDTVLQNPYIGFTTFNSTEGEPLFSLSALGQDKECYPYCNTLAERKGNDQGFYPASTIAYYRILWKDWEVEEDVYDYVGIDRILAQVKESRQHLMLRLMPHTKLPAQDVPLWFSKKVPCPDRSLQGKESPTDVRFFTAFAKAVRALGAYLDQNPLMCAMDISLTGAWGEGHLVEETPKEHLEILMRAYTESFQHTPLMGQIAAPEWIVSANQTHPVGFRADCLGNMDWHMPYYYPERIEPISHVYQKAPVSFEACWHMNHWLEKGWNIDFIIDQSLKWHISSFNNKHTPCPTVWRPAVERWLKKMGYRFSVRRLEFCNKAQAGNQIKLGLWIENAGVAPIYHRLPVQFRLRRREDHRILHSDLDIRTWLPGDTLTDCILSLPDDLPKGSYCLDLQIGEDRYPQSPALQLAMKTERDGFFYHLCEIEITE